MSFDDTCPVVHTAELVGGKWTLLLVRDLAAGRSRFCELERSLAGISPRTLSLRLRALEEDGIVERHTYPEVPPRVEYSLTQKGFDLLPIIESMRHYGRRWLCEEVSQAPAERDAVSASERDAVAAYQ
jgi:DNA-binding HxlR family transcriptional regulator